ncbi:recombinase family protein [Rhizobium ruizarguesonis]|uniref:recombinase family protein n=1 Tax=Rhizobium TaxID=379 RepID=UPI00102FEA3C|nr:MULTISPECIES: recombinase family protein [Rhizobium]MBY5448112.1 recombinase family protein [Rhizobium leguminosarum]TAV37265.1 recombinase family protein [Rhizobium ruizarguesonis]
MRSTIGPTRAFLYARSNGESQNAPTPKADEQLLRLRKHAQDRSYVVVGEARDLARGNSSSRPGLNAVIGSATCSPPDFDVLLVTDFMRLSRDLRLLGAIARRLTSAGIRVVAIDGPFEWREDGEQNLLTAVRNHLREMGEYDEGD